MISTTNFVRLFSTASDKTLLNKTLDIAINYNLLRIFTLNGSFVKLLHDIDYINPVKGYTQ